MGTPTVVLTVVLVMPAFFLHSVTAQACTAQEDKNMMQQCVNPHGRDNQLCSGRGSCVCGACQCNTIDFKSLQRYTGTFCECDDYSCSYVDGKMCGGNGQCKCGMCECLEGWQGKACECSTSNQQCMAANGKVCNDSGNCVCGACKCSSWSGFYGPTCEDCATCEGQCGSKHLQDCVLCRAFLTGSYGSYDDERCSHQCGRVALVETMVDKEKAEKTKTKLCDFIDQSDGCMVKFSYKYDGDKGRPALSVQLTKECPQKSPTSSSTSLRHHRHSVSLGLAGLSAVAFIFTARS